MRTVFLAFLLLPMAGPCRAWDAAVLTEHLRETYDFPSVVALELGKPEPSEIEGFDLVSLTLRVGEKSQVEKLFVSKSGRHYILGGFKDLSVHPDQERLKKMDLGESAYRGKKAAPVQVVEYTDFQCPYCERGYLIMRDQVMKKYPDKVRWIYKSLPLGFHPWARPAAVAVECAKRQGLDRFWDMHDSIFDKQREITAQNAEAKFAALAKEHKLDGGKFSACFDKEETAAFVDKDAEEARLLGISGTPAFVVNGHLIPGADGETIERIVDESLAGKHGKL